MAYVFPTGGQKLVKVVLEGQTQIYDAINRDQSVEINVYKKIGAAVMTSSDWGAYVNTGIADTYEGGSFGYGY